MKTTFSKFEVVTSLADLSKAPTGFETTEQLLYIDTHLPNLVAVSRKTELSRASAYQEGRIIFQDKASCFPAHLLDVDSTNGDIIDACAAPGNKTTHLASLLEKTESGRSARRKIWAVEKDKARAATLENMIEWSGTGDWVSVRAGQDFLRLDPSDRQWGKVQALLLDPSCSGSGIMDRNDTLEVFLPEKRAITSIGLTQSRRKPRSQPQARVVEIVAATEPVKKTQIQLENEKNRLSALSAFQLKLLTHAFRFPSARRIVYSTCSILEIENEHVVCRALRSKEAQRAGWKVLERKHQVHELRDWQTRGERLAFEDVTGDTGLATKLADACIRCEKGGKQGTIGFFLCAFVRDLSDGHNGDLHGSSPDRQMELEDSEEEWQGFGDHMEGAI